MARSVTSWRAHGAPRGARYVVLAVVFVTVATLAAPPRMGPWQPVGTVLPTAPVSTGPEPAARAPALSGLYTLSGTVSAFGDPPAPLNNVNVTVTGQGCVWPPSPSHCASLARQETANGGAFAFSLSNGSYFLYSANTSRWGGDWDAVTINGAAQVVSLLVYPWVPYGNVTEVLPAWNNLSHYADNCNAQTPCQNGTYGNQVPVLSWTQDGAFYVNATDELVFYSFVNHTVTPIARWVPLYQNVMTYDGLENTEWITADGSWVYTVGCLTSCTNTEALTVYAANVTTGRTFEYNYTTVTRSLFTSNAQLDLIGLDGNHSTAALIQASGVIDAYNFWNQTQWVLGTLAFFEANNAYWVPQLNSYIDVQAQGSTQDAIGQYRLSGAGAGGTVRSVYSGTYDYGYKSNGVDGLYLNLTARDLLVTESTSSGNLTTQVFRWGADGTLAGEVRSYSGTKLGAWPNATARPNPVTSEHRPGLAGDTPMLMGYWNGYFDNNSWLYEPNTGSYYSTNVTMSQPSYVGNYRQASIPPSAVEGLFFNTTYEVIEQSVNCRQVDSDCPIDGTADNATNGTLWWTWRLGAPAFPYPATAALAQPFAPGPVVGLNATALSNSVTVTWDPPATGQFPLINYSVSWTTPGAATPSYASVPADAGSYRVTGLPPVTTVTVGVEAWNLHWHGPLTSLVIPTHARPDLITNLTADPSVLDLDMPLSLYATIAANATVTSIGYAGLPAGCVSENTTALLCEPTAAGRFTVIATVTDPLNETDFAEANVTVNPQLSPVEIQGPSSWDADFPVNFSVFVSGSGGTPPYSYAWAFDDGGTANGSSVSHAFTTPGYHVVRATATDRLGEQQNGSTLVAIHAPLSVSLAVEPQPVAAGAPVNVTANVGLTGTAPFSYHWSTGPATSADAVDALIFASPGTYNVSVSVIDAAGATTGASAPVDVVVAPVTAHLSVARSGITDVGVATLLTLNASGGTPPYAVALSGLPFGCASADEAHWTCVPTVAGSFTVSATLRDARGLTGAAATTLVVNPRPTVALEVQSSPPIHPGDSVRWLVAVTGGTAPFTVSFPQVPPGCGVGSVGDAQLTCSPTQAGTFPVAVSVEDARGVFGNASTNLTVIVVPTIGSGLHTTPLSSGPLPITLIGWLIPGVGAGAAALGVGWMLRPTVPAPAPKASPKPVPPTDPPGSDRPLRR